MERSIQVVSDVKDLGELLSGAHLEQVQMTSTDRDVTVVLELTRALLERQDTARQGPFRRPKTPWTKCELRLSKIHAITVKHLSDQAHDQAPLMSCDAIPGGYQLTIQAPDGLQLTLGMDRLDGAFTDVGSPIESP